MKNKLLTVSSCSANCMDETVPRLTKIPNFENYGISVNAEIYNLKNNKKISTYIGIDGYEHCVLYKKGKRYRKRVHRLMGKTFLGNPEVVAHKDNNKANNKLENLKRSTHKENVQETYNDRVYRSTYRVSVVCENKLSGEILNANSMREAERLTGVDRHRIKTFIQGTKNNYTNWNFKYK